MLCEQCCIGERLPAERAIQHMQSRGLLAARQRQQYRLLTPTKHLLQQDTASWMHSARPADGAVPVGDPPSRLGREADAGRNALPAVAASLKPAT